MNKHVLITKPIFLDSQVSLAPIPVSLSVRHLVFSDTFGFHSVSVSETSQSVEMTKWWPTKKIDININMEIQFGERVGHGGWLIGPKLF